MNFYDWMFNTTINVKLVDKDYLTVNTSKRGSCLYWEKTFTNRFSYWIDKTVINFKEYEKRPKNSMLITFYSTKL